MGSWKIMPMSRPRSSRMLFPIPISSRPRKAILPSPWKRAVSGGRSCMIDIAVTDLPEPDSPTTPRVSPSGIEKETPSTARTTASEVWK